MGLGISLLNRVANPQAVLRDTARSVPWRHGPVCVPLGPHVRLLLPRRCAGRGAAARAVQRERRGASLHAGPLDGILQAVTAEYLCMRYPGEGEGFWTSLRSNLVNNKMLGHLAMKIGMDKWLIVSRHVEDLCNGRHNLRILGSLLEAWIGSLYRDLVEEDRGKAFARAFDWIVCLFETHVDFAKLISQNTNYKDQLLKHYQATYHQPPRYKEVAVEGPLHNRIFTMGVLSPEGAVVEKATARNKKVAEQEASRRALVKFGVISASAPQREDD